MSICLNCLSKRLGVKFFHSQEGKIKHLVKAEKITAITGRKTTQKTTKKPAGKTGTPKVTKKQAK